MRSGPRGKTSKIMVTYDRYETNMFSHLINVNVKGVNGVKGIIIVVYWRGCKNDQARKELRKACKEKYRQEILCYRGYLSLELLSGRVERI